MYSIRVASIDDCAGINSVSKYLGYTEISYDECNDKLQHLLQSETDKIYVAVCKGVIIGWLHLFLACRLASPDFYEIGGLVVNPEFRKQGIGKDLVDHVTNMQTGKLRVRCNEKRKASHLFYMKMGFSEEKVQRVFELGSKQDI